PLLLLLVNDAKPATVRLLFTPEACVMFPAALVPAVAVSVPCRETGGCNAIPPPAVSTKDNELLVLSLIGWLIVIVPAPLPAPACKVSDSLCAAPLAARLNAASSVMLPACVPVPFDVVTVTEVPAFNAVVIVAT